MSNFFDKKIKPLLTYIGAIGAVIMTIAYMVVVFVLIRGFKVNKILDTTIFSIINAAVGFIIMQFLKIQGQSFAQNIPENKEIISKYYSSKMKAKTLHSMKYYWVKSSIAEFFTKVLTIAASSIGMIYIVIKGSNDWSLLLLALFNLLLFFCFGLLALVKTFDFYNNEYMNYIKNKLEEAEYDNEKLTGTSSEE